MAKEGGKDYPEDYSALIREYGDQAIECCIEEWNKLCPQYPLSNLTEMRHRKRWLFHSHDVSVLKEQGGFGQISKIEFEVNEHLTAKAFRKHKDSSVIVVDCRTWWDCGECHETHGWSNHITVDVTECHIANFPEINPVSPHLFCCPLP